MAKRPPAPKGEKEIPTKKKDDIGDPQPNKKIRDPKPKKDIKLPPDPDQPNKKSTC